MVEYIIFVFPVLHLITAIGVIGAVILAFKLYNETDKAWYWLSLFLSAVFFALAQWIIVLTPLVQSFAIIGVLREFSEVLAVMLFAVSCYGIYKGMLEIRKMVG